MTIAARFGFAAGRVSGWSTFSDLATTASTARVSSLAYGAAECSRCWALMIREDAISSWARVILAVDWMLLIRRRTARSCAPILANTALLCLERRLRRDRILAQPLFLDVLGLHRLGVLLGHEQRPVRHLEGRAESSDRVFQRHDRVLAQLPGLA